MNSKKARIFLGLLIILFLVNLPGISRGDTPSGLDRLVNQIENLFPFTEGYVVSVNDNLLILDLKQGQPVKPGDRLKLIRYGKELTHPVTQQKLGRMEKDLGEVEIIEVRKDFSRAKALNPLAIIRKGDGVRSPFKKIALLLAPVNAGSSATLNPEKTQIDLGNKISRHSRFEVPDFDLSLWMLESDLRPKDLLVPRNLAKLREKVHVDYLVFSTVQAVKGKQVLKYRLISALDGLVLKEAKILTGELPTRSARTARSMKPKEQDVQTDFSQKRRDVDFASKQTFPFEIVDFDVGDINGDGTVEFVIIDSYRVRVYKYFDGKFKFITQAKVKKGENKFISVDVADINGNGKAEIFVTNIYLDRLGSFVLEAGTRGFKKIWEDVQLYFRVIRPFNSKPRLLVQKPDFENSFGTGIRMMRYKNRKYVKGPKLKTPPIRGMKFLLYGLTQADVNFDKTVETIILDKDYHLRVYSPDGSLLVRSDEYYGHDPRIIDIGVDNTDGFLPTIGRGVSYRGRLLLEQSGNRKYMLVPRNHRLGGSLLQSAVIVSGGSLVILGLDREGFSKTFETREQKGYIAAYQVTDVPRKERKIHVAIVQSGGVVSRGKSTIFTYNWTS